MLRINLELETYIITIYYEDCREGNTITVLPVLTADDVKMKYQYSKTAYLTAHVQSYRTLHLSLENRYNKKAIDSTPKLLIDSV